MLLFKILKTILDLLPWALLALILYALWPYLMMLPHMAAAIRNLI